MSGATCVTSRSLGQRRRGEGQQSRGTTLNGRRTNKITATLWRSGVAGTRRRCPPGHYRSAQGARRPSGEITAATSITFHRLHWLPSSSLAVRRPSRPPAPYLHILKLYLRNVRCREGNLSRELALAGVYLGFRHLREVSEGSPSENVFKIPLKGCLFPFPSEEGCEPTSF